MKEIVNLYVWNSEWCERFENKHIYFHNTLDQNPAQNLQVQSNLDSFHIYLDKEYSQYIYFVCKMCSECFGKVLRVFRRINHAR